MPLAYIRQDADLSIRTAGGDIEFELRVEDAVHQFKTPADAARLGHRTCVGARELDSASGRGQSERQ